MMPLPENRLESTASTHEAPATLRLMGRQPLAPPPETEGASGFEPRRLINGLKYHWFLLLVLGTLAGGGLGAAAWYLLPAKYTTYAVVRIAATEPIKLDTKDGGGRNEFVTFLKTQAMLIKSEYVLRAAIRDGDIAKTSTLSAQEDPAKWLEENLLVEYSENSEIVKIGLAGDNPQELAKIVNAIQAAYMKEVVQKDQTKSSSYIGTLETIQKFLEERLKNTQTNVQMDSKKAGSAPTTAIPEPLKVRLGSADFARMNEDLRKLRTDLEVAREREKDLIEKLVRVDALEAPAADVETVLGNDQTYKDLKRKVDIIQKKADYLKSISRMPNSNPDYQYELDQLVKAQAAAEDHKRKLKVDLTRALQRNNRRDVELKLEEARTLARALDLRVKSLEMELTRVEVIKETAPGHLIADTKNADEIKLYQMTQVYEMLLRKISTLIVETRTPARVQDLQKAVVPVKREMKKQLIGTGFAAFLGFALVGACIALYESRVMRLFGARDLAANPEINMLGLLPDLGPRDGNGADPFMEAVDQVRVLLSRNVLSKRSQAVAITSAAEGEGKSTLAGHLAVSLAKTDLKTVLVDCNLRRPGLHEHLGLPMQPGACEVLRGEKQLQEVVQRTNIENLAFLAAGAWDTQAQQAMGRDRIRRMLDKLRQEFDVVIIDTHAVLPVADTILVGQHCDAVVMCARRHVSRQPLVEQAYRRVTELGVENTGLIFLGEAAK